MNVPGPGPSQSWQPVATWLATSALGIVATAAGIVGLADADLDRAAINFSNGVPAAFGLILGGFLLGVIAPASRRAQRILAFLGVLSFGVGVFWLVFVAVRAKSESDRPRVASSLVATPMGQRVQGTVSGAGMEANQHILVRIIGVSSAPTLAPNRIGRGRTDEGAVDRQLVYSSRTGAMADGTTTVRLDVPIAAGLYERLDVEGVVSDDDGDVETGSETASCDQETSDIGCETLMVPPVFRRPRLSARWRLPAQTPPVLAVVARMGNLSADDRVLLSVLRVKEGKLAGRIYGASWAPDTAGMVEEQLELPVEPLNRPICVVLRTLRGAPISASESKERFGPCRARSQGMAVQLGTPPPWSR